MNNENLKPCIKSSDKARELGRIGGKKSGEAKREKKKMKELALLMLSAQLDKDKADKLKMFGVTEQDADYNAGIIAKQIAKAMKGDLNAVKWLQDVSGQNAVQEIHEEHTGDVGFTLEISKETMNALKGLKDGDKQG